MAARIAVNHSIDRYRQARRRHRSEQPLQEADRLDGPGAARADGPSPERQVWGREIQERVEAALLGLTERQRAVFVLRHYDEMSLEEIASTLGLHLGTVKSSLHRAVRTMRERLRGVRA